MRIAAIRIRVSFWAAAVAIVLAGLRIHADTIELTGGKKLEGVDVLQGRWDTVQYKQGNKPAVSLPVNQVVALRRTDPIMDRVAQLIDAGDYSRALEELKVVPSNKAWIQAEAMYLIGKAQAAAGKYRDAAASFKAYLEKYKGEKDWYVPWATLGLADALVAAKQPGTAETHYKELVEFGGQWELYAKLGQAEATVQAKGKAGALDARRLYDEVSKSRSAPVQLRQKALVGRARVFLIQDQPQNVVKELSEGFFDSPKPEELLYSAERAEASLLMGRAYVAMGGKENLEQAEIWLLRVPALYGIHPALYAEACDLLVDVYGKLNNQARAQEWKARKGAGTTKSAEGK